MNTQLNHLLFSRYFLENTRKIVAYSRTRGTDTGNGGFCLLCKSDAVIHGIFGQAIHYYEENEIEVGKPMDCQVVVNHVVKLTAEEKAEARQNAVRKYQEEELRKLQNRHRPSARKENQPQPSLFDLGL